MADERNSKELKRLASIKRKNGDELRISRDQFTNDKGEAFEYVSLRIWFQPKEGGEPRPTQKGLTVRKNEVDQVAAAIKSAFASSSTDDDSTPF